MTNKWNVIFLLNAASPTQIMLLRRAAHKSFAPHYYTGIGRKVEENEPILESAYRELQEETGIDSVELTEYARCYIDDLYSLHYFWGLYPGEVPVTEDGVLEWVKIDAVLDKKIIPTTKEVLQEWKSRLFSIKQPFTVYVKETGQTEGVKLVVTGKVEETLK